MRVTVLRAAVGLGFSAFLVVTPGAAQDYRMAVTNGTNIDIEYFYYSECSANNWLGDRLGSNEVIRPGDRRIFDMFDGIRDCCRDMRAKFVNGAARERMNVNVCRESEWFVQ